MRAGIALVAATVLTASMAGAEEAKPPSDRVLVVAAAIEDLEPNHYLWAAEMTASRLEGNTEVLEGGLAAALKEAREHRETVRGIVEVVIDVYSFREEVQIVCYEPAGRQLWTKRVTMNTGGSEEKLARNMLERALKKVDKRPTCP